MLQCTKQEICNQSFESSRVLKNIHLVFVIALFLLDPSILLSKESPVSLKDKLYKQTRITFTSTRDGNYEIYVINADGKKIVFLSNRDGNFEIYVMNADGTNQTNWNF